ncbi:phage-like protein [Acetobacter malorum DSM 14337]|uniref:Phage-like protein n=1 Tax=Acetobacter malorum DSM 14337 TaxID=1307910 RepID=A0ABQ0PM90_9PROT|nr:DUF2213 domain-containing protein [Acetobacter malorum]KXV07022.1 hypothetical protein AD930_05695 [Acetobacter malorum]GBQ75755.1 phage-like protein [Acetobacter malorum DSM 14337]
MPHFLSMAFDRSVRETSPEGHLRINRCILSAATVSPYLGKEIVDGARLGFRPDVIYQLYRDPQALAKAADTMNGKPILMQHRAVSSTDHPADITVGAVSDVRFENPNLIGALTIWDRSAISAIENGSQRGVSAGYRYRVQPGAGFINGQRYDGRMVDISFNHLALVAEPRVTTAIIGDSLPKGMKVTNGYPLQNRSVSQILEELTAAPQEITSSTAMDSLVSQRFAERQERERKAFSEQFPEVSRIQVKG